ncbi:MAG: solute-binding protein [Methylococcaceae bacterium]|nr:solute-binding protein [Methylococcaceae bacterium]
MTLLRTALLSSMFALVMMLTACDDSSTSEEQAPAQESVLTLKVIAGSELKDIEPMLATIQQQTNIKLEMHYIGTLDGAEKIVLGQEHYDLAWFSHAKYLSLLQEDNKVIHGQEKIGLSPVIPAVKESLARQWGWVNNPDVTWSDIAEKVKSGELKYAMSDPTASNSGFSTVMSVQAAFSNAGDAITAQDVDAEKLKSFFSGHDVTSGSSGFLAETYLRDQNRLGAIFNYESILMDLNRNPNLQEKLVLIYPKEGVVTADYPLILLAQNQNENYQKLITYLKAPAFQTWMMNNTDRRPVNTTVALGEQFPKGYLMDLPFPANIDTVNEILFAYLDDRRKPSHSFFVLDLSGSMQGKRIESLKRAINNLAGDDQSITGKFSRFRNRERVTIITFNHSIIGEYEFNVTKDGSSIQKIREYISGLKPQGGTAIFTALQRAYEKARLAKDADPDRFYSIVLMSDGINNDGISYDQFNDFYIINSDYVAGVRTFPVLFGNANQTEMEQVANLTGGRVFDSRKTSLAQAFKQIRGYQ